MLLSLTSLKEVTLLATLKIHSCFNQFFDKSEYTADFSTYNDILFYLQSMHSKFNSYMRSVHDLQTEESFAFLDQNLNMITTDQYHVKTVKEGDIIYLAPVLVGGGGKRGSLLLLIGIGIATGGFGLMAGAGAGGAAATGMAVEGGAVAVGSVQAGLTGSAAAGGGILSSFAAMPSFARSILGNLAMNLITGLFTKKPKKMETDTSTRQNGMFGNLTNTMESGVPIPLQYGLIRVAGQMLSGYIDSDEHGKSDVVKVEDKFSNG